MVLSTTPYQENNSNHNHDVQTPTHYQDPVARDISNRDSTYPGCIDFKFHTDLPELAKEAYDNIPKVLNLSGIIVIRSSYVQEGRSRVDLYGGDETLRAHNGIKWTLHLRTNKTWFETYKFWLADNIDDEIKSWEDKLLERNERERERGRQPRDSENTSGANINNSLAGGH